MAALLAIAAPVAGEVPIVEVMTWWDAREAAVSLTFDDSVADHWTVAVPELDARGFRGTFFTVTSIVDWASAKAAAQTGHEIGSHSTTLEALDLQSSPYGLMPDAEARIVAAKQAIETQIGIVVPGYRCVSFAYPFGMTSTRSDASNLPDLVSRYHLFSRTAGGPNGNAPSPGFWTYRWQGTWYGAAQPGGIGPRPDLHYHWIGLGPGGGNFSSSTSATTVGNAVDTAIGANAWAVFLWHSVGSTPTAFNAQLGAIASRSARAWIAPFGEVARYAKQRTAVEALGGVGVQVTGETITITVADGLDDALHDQPLTLAFEKPAGWPDTPHATQGGKPVRIVVRDNYILVDAVPDAGALVVSPEAPPAPVAAPVVAATLAGNSLSLRWEGRAGWSYVVRRSDAPGGPFGDAPVASATPSSNGPVETIVPADGDRSFYQVTGSAP